MTIRAALTISLLSLSLAACGGKSKPAETTPPAEEEVAADCCCEFVEETGEGDEMQENQVNRSMTKADCDGNSGQCVDAATCAAPTE